ncbi:YbaN family protein [Flavobacterium procerum]|uniref:YbaN family protein n=1 Tax=Flavobacterium procerum TaxID=1455569 RepID=A0ABV6BW02_9FLAO
MGGRLLKYVKLFLGIISLVLAYIGILLPGVPAVPFILSAGYFFLNSSPKFYQWLLRRKFVGHLLRKYLLRTKKSKGTIWFVISQLWVSLITFQIILRPVFPVIVVVNLAGIAVSLFIYKMISRHC